VEVVGGVAHFLICDWLVEVPTFHPEPDFPSDLYAIVPCGANVRSLDGTTTLGHTACDAGHVRHTYGSPEWAEAEAYAEFRENNEIG
jgi:hypothetical protein